MAINILDLIGTVYRDRLGRAELAQRERESAADRALRERMQGREFEFQGKEGASERDLRRQLENERLGLTRSTTEMNQLSQLAELLGGGASNIPQADVLRLIAGRFGVPVNTAQLRNASRVQSPRGGAAPSAGLGSRSLGLPRWGPEPPRFYLYGAGGL